ncbi:MULTISPECIES: DUF1217 domain-containing protein [Acetobacter]|jgi:hypothetical protein|uniref:DUF1217 domain-containing protein n=1 Tax=Acetobacter lovaniensis TaxID=104100 RepID=A0A841QG48_9PROT|nr:DUF1217 domain-containing protein [Acetobacter lovaniensis]MBB6457163.1 hypothetical protein [Acetobacter lovaniensis]MCI1697743.1 DUF1217 domain-containing protein [Acetobacter lovaniensis]MCI1795088.1 DUF1217 domain-containing protein [Acetobacter lovaniensis]MCP1239495.1 DUF1217 domain-containing protein [Acetobacter lovaniensis]GBQ63313.1 hypothetical protein AA0474_0249 [Acetobacter lovaniensis NRIC 0474]
MSISGISPVSQYLTALKNEDAAASTYAKTDVTTKQATAGFEQAAASITTVSGLMKNYSALNVVLGAYGMGSYASATALVQKLLTQDPTSSSSLAKSSSNATWLAFADAFKTWGQGGGSVQTSPLTSSTITSIVNEYQTDTTQSLQSDLAAFNNAAPGITTASALLANTAVLNVVLSAYGMDALEGDTSVLTALLTQDPSSSTSLAQTSGNAAWQLFANAFQDMGKNGGTASASPFTSMTMTTITQGYSIAVGSAVNNNVNAFKAEAATMTSASDLMNNQTVLSMVMSTYGLDSSTDNSKILTALLTQDPTSSTSLAQASGSTAWQDFATTFQSMGQNNGVAASTPFTAATISSIAAKYADVIDTGTTSAIASFRSDAAGITSVNSLLGNSSALQVVLGAYGLGSLAADPAVVKTLLTQDPDSATSLAQTSGNTAWQTFAQAFKAWGQNNGQGAIMSTSFVASLSASFQSNTNTLVQSGLTNFENAAGSITTASALLSNTAVLSVVTGAFGIDASSNETTLLNSLLTQDPSSSTSLASASGNSTWQSFATDFKVWGANGGSVSATPFTSDKIQSIVESYQMRQYESSSALSDNGVGNALYFTRTMSSVTSLAQLMSDPTLLKVAETVSGYDPDQFGALDYDQQVRLLSKKVDLSKLSTPKQIQQYAEQYLAMLQINPQTPDTPASMLDLFGGSSDDDILSLFGGDDSSGDLYSSLF